MVSRVKEEEDPWRDELIRSLDSSRAIYSIISTFELEYAREGGYSNGNIPRYSLENWNKSFLSLPSSIESSKLARSARK